VGRSWLQRGSWDAGWNSETGRRNVNSRRIEWDIDNNGNGCLGVYCDACAGRTQCEACEDAKELEEEWAHFEDASEFFRSMKPPTQPRPEGKR
jgi:hypothetical protein